jgi:hypothetical protein
MTHNEMAQMSRDELMDLILMQAQQIAMLQSEVEALRLKLENGKKPPTIRAILPNRPRGIGKEICQRRAKSAGAGRRKVIRNICVSWSSIQIIWSK